MQELLYSKYSSAMYGICLRYAKDDDEAKEFLQTGFIKIFQKLDTIKNDKALSSWIRTIMVNNALTLLNAKNKVVFEEVEENTDLYVEEENVFEPVLSEEVILKAIAELKNPYKIIFNLACIESYSHKQIGEELNILESTSRSHLRRARAMLREVLKKEIALKNKDE